MSAPRDFDTVGDLAAATLDVLDERGWGRVGSLLDRAPCIVDAVLLALGLPPVVRGARQYLHPAVVAMSVALDGWLYDDPTWTDALDASLRAARHHDMLVCITLPGALWRWNDDRRTTHEDVRLALKHVAHDHADTPLASSTAEQVTAG